mmetsp:Transcript_54488/g.151876  ORF Transcript_54488/g.151876 Transcript_54488/m.151876 type:complete len:273 (+) Transcript_54488:1479-2297(+)
MPADAYATAVGALPTSAPTPASTAGEDGSAEAREWMTASSASRRRRAHAFATGLAGRLVCGEGDSLATRSNDARRGRRDAAGVRLDPLDMFLRHRRCSDGRGGAGSIWVDTHSASPPCFRVIDSRPRVGDASLARCRRTHGAGRGRRDAREAPQARREVFEPRELLRAGAMVAMSAEDAHQICAQQLRVELASFLPARHDVPEAPRPPRVSPTPGIATRQRGVQGHDDLDAVLIAGSVEEPLVPLVVVASPALRGLRRRGWRGDCRDGGSTA